jgi:hypothetical protein
MHAGIPAILSVWQAVHMSLACSALLGPRDCLQPITFQVCFKKPVYDRLITSCSHIKISPLATNSDNKCILRASPCPFAIVLLTHGSSSVIQNNHAFCTFSSASSKCPCRNFPMISIVMWPYTATVVPFVAHSSVDQ